MNLLIYTSAGFMQKKLSFYMSTVSKLLLKKLARGILNDLVYFFHKTRSLQSLTTIQCGCVWPAEGGLTCPGRKTGSFTGLSLVIFRGTNCLKDFPCRMPIGNLVGSFIAGSDKFTPGHPLISAHPKLYNSHCIVHTAQFTLYSAHCTIHTV